MHNKPSHKFLSTWKTRTVQN